jgi:hypothetical protein
MINNGHGFLKIETLGMLALGPVMTGGAGLFGDIYQSILQGLLPVLHDAGALISRTRAMAGFATDALEIRGMGITQFISAFVETRGMAFQTFRVFFLTFFLQTFKRLGMGALFPFFKHISLSIAPVAHLAFFCPDILKITGIHHNKQKRHTKNQQQYFFHFTSSRLMQTGYLPYHILIPISEKK